MDIVETVDVKQRLEKIKLKGYWRVNIRPTKFEKSRIDSLDRCWELVKSYKVFLRGWDYPHLDEEKRTTGEDWIQSGADFEGDVELWRFYQSGQFIHYFACIEDYDMHKVPRQFLPFQKRGASHGLSILSTLYRVTEIFEFAARLTQKGVLQPGLQISIRLAKMSNRGLFHWDRVFLGIHICPDNEIAFDKEFSIAEIIAAGHEEALDATTYIFEKFGWKPSRQILAEEQRKLLERRL